MTDKKYPALMTVKEVAELLHVSPRTIQRYISEHLLNAVRLKHTYRIKVDALLKSILGDNFSAQ